MRTSVVVPVKNDAVALTELLRALSEQTKKPDEVVLIVTDSLDDSLVVAKKWRPPAIQVRVISQRSANRSQARNIGVARASGEVIIFTDAGCAPQNDWVENISKPFRDAKVNLVSGYTAGHWANPFEEAQVPFVLVPLEQIEVKPLPATRNMAIRRKTFLEAGGFREDLQFAEDFEFSRRLKVMGIVARFVPRARVAWRPRPSITSFFLMIARLTAGDVEAGIVRPGMVSMWLRYIFFIALIVISPKTALLAYLAYLLFKLTRFRFQQTPAYFWAVTLQAVCDAAVLAGSLWGVLLRTFLAIHHQKRDNTTNVD